ncbi:uncharacterized protein [Henckelia pumila]|uniref:uncharacterized protein n=1 Tax=Henckelia pumila TaxID=405737 RepID=UPI003C6E28F0
MERAIHVTDSQVEHASPRPAFHDACAFLNLQNGQGIAGLALLSESKSCFCRNLNDFGISEYPMAHYAQQARFSSCFAICASTSKENETQVFEFFLQLGSRDDAYIYSIFGLLIHIMKMKLKRFKIANGGHLLEKYLATDEVRHQHPFKCPIIHNRLGQINQHSNENVAKRIGCNATYSLSEFREYLHEPNLSCLPVPLTYENGWICWREKGDHENNSLMPSLSPSLQKKVKFLLGEILSLCTCDPSIIQLWAHETIENRSCLSTSNQPFALGLLYKGLCQYRKQCMDSYYYVGNGATDDELGPPGRVFLSGLPESSPDLRLYSAKEFPLQDHLANYHTRRYLALPLFDLHHEKCIGVLEVVGCPYKYKDIEKIIEAVNMRWKHVSYSSWFKASHS